MMNIPGCLQYHDIKLLITKVLIYMCGFVQSTTCINVMDNICGKRASFPRYNAFDFLNYSTVQLLRVCVCANHNYFLNWTFCKGPEGSFQIYWAVYSLIKCLTLYNTS